MIASSRRRRPPVVVLGLLALAAPAVARGGPEGDAPARRRPNVVLILSDDQGYGDLGVTGNSRIRTPHIDRLARGSASMSHFYVSPVCSPTRASLMTGRYNYRTRVVDTFVGRSMMDPAEVTLAEVLREAGYATGLFGKWHLGDHYPMRPHDQGFEDALVLLGGGLAQPSEPLENRRRYTDPVLFQNGRKVETKGYCTDVFFDAAIDFIERTQQAGRSFFVYLAPNAPHDPLHDVPAGWLEHYRGQDLRPLVADRLDRPALEAEQDRLARTFAMISNIDDNVGRLLDRLRALRLVDDTLVVFLVDNGPASARYVGPFRSTKGDVHEGGVRSPFFAHWPAALRPGHSSDVPVAHIDVLPTLLEACRVAPPKGLKLDGRSFLPLLRGRKVDWPERQLVIQSHRGDVPVLYHHFLVRGERFKLLNASGFGRDELPGPPQWELYDVVVDPGETRNLAAERPGIVARLKAAYEEWFRDVSSTRPDNYAPPRIPIGTPHENPVMLTRQDWRHEVGRPWADDSIGRWEVAVASPGPYDVRLLFEARDDAGVARIEIGARSLEVPIAAGATECTFRGVTLPMGEASFRAILVRGDDRRGTYQAELVAG